MARSYSPSGDAIVSHPGAIAVNPITGHAEVPPRSLPLMQPS